ncbi:hypothetical protein [Flavobacterium beibuense]|uniref:hypothetical protein n=1 Tax=Flavobacterium beibuense TaxID=657326 RepID=UPI003A8EA944
MKKISLVFSVVLVLFSFLNDKSDSITLDDDKSIIPMNRSIFTIMGDVDKYTSTQLYEFYKIDVAEFDDEYVEDLKNMWFCLISSKISSDGDEEQKRYFLNEQISLSSNMPNYGKFYFLLRSCSFMEREEMSKIASQFYSKNKAVLENIKYESDEEEKKYMQDLVLAGRYHGLLINNNDK